MIIIGSVGWHPFKKWLTVGTGKLASSFEIFEETVCVSEIAYFGLSGPMRNKYPRNIRRWRKSYKTRIWGSPSLTNKIL